MKYKTPLHTSLFVLVFTSIIVSSQQQKWFGDNDQFMCHCENSANCDTNGDCPGMKCEQGWFGPQCQYLDLASSLLVDLTDGDDATCVDTSTRSTHITIDLSREVRFSWMRIVTNSPEKLHGLTFTFWSSSQTDVKEKTPLRGVFINDATMDVHGELDERIKKVQLQWTDSQGPASLCSVYVSGGRNVALKQTTSQSSTGADGASSRAVDGGTSHYYYHDSCTHTMKDASNYWAWNTSVPVTVDRYQIYNRKENSQCRLRYFRLFSYNNEEQVQMYQDAGVDTKYIYEVFTDTPGPLTSVIISLNVNFYPGGSNTECNSIDATILTLCEVQMFGDSVCTSNKWGRQCEKNCGNCKIPSESCYVSTGMCRPVCALGYQGIHCDQECPEKFHGDCKTRCNTSCVDELCDHVTGHCDSCYVGKQGEFCEQDCLDGFWGDGCVNNCSEHCGGDGLCDNVDGTCLSGCEPGYRTDHCNQSCSDGFWGDGCANNCSEHCGGDGFCNNVNGSCLSGCKAGYRADRCDQNCSDGFWGDECANNCIEHCDGDGLCNNVNGTCLSGCKPGYRTDHCNQTCEFTTFGHGCNSNCSTNCIWNVTTNPAVCHYESGQCLLGCQESFTGLTCLTPVQVAVNDGGGGGSSGVDPLVIALPIALVVIVVIAVLGLVFYRRRRKQRGSGKDSLDPIQIDDLDQSSPTVQRAAVVSTSEGRQDRKREHPPGALSKTPSCVDHGQTAYINMDPINSPTAVSVKALKEYIASHDAEFFAKQFEQTPSAEATTVVAHSPENKLKNRYQNIPAYDHSRVRLEKDLAKNHEDYYNACFVQGYSGEQIIASQGPNKATLKDFIRMLWEQNIDTVVMLTNLVEECKIKCEQYWPDQDELVFGEINVKLVDFQRFPDYTVRNLVLIKNDDSSHMVKQFHFTSWPDKGAPKRPWALVNFLKVVEAHRTSFDTPLLVHCSAGVGRTGTFIAMRNIVKEATDTGFVDCHLQLVNLRKDRIYMIQTAAQYSFLHEAILVALMCRNSSVKPAESSEQIKDLKEHTLASGETKLKEEFEMVCSLVQMQDESDQEMQKTEEKSKAYWNEVSDFHQKNRFIDILPRDRYRPGLHSSSKGNEYINAVLVPGSTMVKQQILTQLPLPATVVDFWRLVIQYEVSIIVSFDMNNSSDETVGDFMPDDCPETIKCGDFEITTNDFYSGPLCDIQVLKVQSQTKKKGLLLSNTMHTTQHRVVYLKSTRSDMTAEDWLKLINDIKSQSLSEEGRILYTCRNGADLSGFACVAYLLLNRMERDQVLSVPLVVGEIKSMRPQVIPNVAQYQLLYKVLEANHENAGKHSNVSAPEELHEYMNIELPGKQRNEDMDSSIPLSAKTSSSNESEENIDSPVDKAHKDQLNEANRESRQSTDPKLTSNANNDEKNVYYNANANNDDKNVYYNASELN